jgi:uncharacterized protein YraI
MLLHRLALGAAGAVLALAFSAGTALAATAYASATVNVRAGAGTGYPVVDVLRPGQRVDVDYCRGSWCMVSKGGPDGWVSANYLTRDRYDDNDYYDDYDEGDFFIERPRHYRPFYPFYRSQVCWGGKNTSLCFSD